MLQDHDADDRERLPIKDQVRKGLKAAASIAPLIPIKRKMPRMIFDRIDRRPKFDFEAVGDIETGFSLVVGEDLVEILLNERMKGEPGAHDRLRQRVTPLQNSDSPSGLTLPFFISTSRRAASPRISAGVTTGAALRSSSLANLRRERRGSFSAKSWISDAELMRAESHE